MFYILKKPQEAQEKKTFIFFYFLFCAFCGSKG